MNSHSAATQPGYDTITVPGTFCSRRGLTNTHDGADSRGHRVYDHQISAPASSLTVNIPANLHQLSQTEIDSFAPPSEVDGITPAHVDSRPDSAVANLNSITREASPSEANDSVTSTPLSTEETSNPTIEENSNEERELTTREKLLLLPVLRIIDARGLEQLAEDRTPDPRDSTRVKTKFEFSLRRVDSVGKLLNCLRTPE